MGSTQGPISSEVEQARTAPEFGAHTPLSEKLLAVAIRAQNFTGSTGIAIALTEGQEMICRANWGTSAPEVGAKLSIEHSFTGLCVRTGESVRCDDAQTDSRVDPDACRALGISAIAAAPVRRGLKVIGVIAAFSDTPNAFTDKHLLILNTLSEVIVELLDDPHPVQPFPQVVETAADPARAAGIAQAPVTPPIDRAAVTVIASEPAVPASQAEPVTHVAPSAPTQPEAPAAVASPPVLVPPSSSAAVASPAWLKRPEAAEPSHSVKDPFAAPRHKEKEDEILPAAMDPGPPPKRTKTGDADSGRLTLVQQPTAIPVPDFGATGTFTFGGLETDWSPARRWLLPVALAVLAIVVIAGWRWHRSGRTSAGTEVPAVSAPEESRISPLQAEQEQATEPPLAAASQPKHSPISRPVATATAPATKPNSASGTPADVTLRRGREPVVEFIGSIRRRPSGLSDTTPEGQAPQIALSAPELPTALAKPVPTNVTGPVSRVVPAQVLQRVQPVYPEAARRLSVSGRVAVKATITKTGTVSNVRWVSGNDLFRDSAITALRQWRYKPATLNGQPVESDLEIVLQFNRPTNQ